MSTSDVHNIHRDPRSLTFSQAQGYVELPKTLQLGELPSEVRTHIWNVFFISIDGTKMHHGVMGSRLGGPWLIILKDVHLFHHTLPIDEWDDSFELHRTGLRWTIENSRFNDVFDLIQFIIYHPNCPRDFIDMVKGVFTRFRLAYSIVESGPPTIVPAVTDAEGKSIVASVELSRQAGLDGTTSHLVKATELINEADWAGSIRESIHAVESVARQLDTEAALTLGSALKSLEKHQSIHPALGKAFIKLYGYTSDEQGIRHALLDLPSAEVGIDEAVFMLGACASFASYLWRKHVTAETP